MNILFQPIGFFGLLLVLLGLSFLITQWGSRQGKQIQQDLDSALASNVELQKNAKALQEQINKLNAELSLKQQMYDGLKGQFDELDKDYTKLAEKAAIPPKREPAGDSGSPLIKII
jgi:peptidoglycan hydrolase CwlO-like protein